MAEAGQCNPPSFRGIAYHSTATTTVNGDYRRFSQRMSPPITSPAAAEAGRLQRADAAMLRFCTDLNGLVGRVMVPPEMLDQEGMDPLTAEIYEAAIEAGLDYNAVMAGDNPLDTPTWMKNAGRVLAKLRRRVPEDTFNRVLDVVTGTEKDVLEDPDAKVALDYAEGYFDTGTADDEVLADLATCLLDYAFIRQGLDDSFVPEEKPEPKALPPAKEKSKSRRDLILEGHRRELFVKSVKEALLDWKESLIDQVERLQPTSIYRVAMVNSGYPTGDELAKQCFTGAMSYRNPKAVSPFHPSILVTIGHAALALEKISRERGVPTDRVPYKLVHEFCRTCGNPLDDKRHGCCRNDIVQQTKDRQYLDSLAEMESYALYDSFFSPKSADKYTSDKGGYLLRCTPNGDGTDRYEVHVKDLWDKGIWQEVPDREAAVQLAKRVRDEHEREKALAKRKPQMTELVGEAKELDAIVLTQEQQKQIVDIANKAADILDHVVQSKALREAKAQASLGRSLKVLVTIACAAGLALTGKVVFIPLLFVGWLMAWMLIDKKAVALAAAAEHKALKASENPLSEDEPFVKKG